SADGRRVLTAGKDGGARVWDPVTHRTFAYIWDMGPIRAAAFSPDGSRFAVAADAGARVYDAATGKPVTPPLRHDGATTCVSFSPNGRQMVTGSDDRAARVWDATTGEPVTPPLRHSQPVRDACFSPDGRRVLTASADGATRLWEVSS